MSSRGKSIKKAWDLDSLDAIFTAELTNRQPEEYSQNFLLFLTRIAKTNTPLPEVRRGLAAKIKIRLSKPNKSRTFYHLTPHDLQEYLDRLERKNAANKQEREQKPDLEETLRDLTLNGPPHSPSSTSPSESSQSEYRPSPPPPRSRAARHRPIKRWSPPSTPPPRSFSSFKKEATVSRVSSPSPPAIEGFTVRGGTRTANSTPEAADHADERPYDARSNLEYDINNKKLDLRIAREIFEVAEEKEKRAKKRLDVQKKKAEQLLLLVEGGGKPGRDKDICDRLLGHDGEILDCLGQLGQLKEGDGLDPLNYNEKARRSDGDIRSAYDALITAIKTRKDIVYSKTQGAENRQQQAVADLAECQANLDSCRDKLQEASGTRTRLEAEINNMNQEMTSLEPLTTKKHRVTG